MAIQTLQWQKQQQTLEVLASLSYRTGELNTYLQAVAKGVSQLIGLDLTVVTLCHGDSEKILASSVDLGEAANEVYSLHGTLTARVMAGGCRLVVEDTHISPELETAAEGYGAYLGVPMITPTGKVIGTICSFQNQPRQFNAEEIQVAEIFAERAATAIDNYRLYQQQQQFNLQLQAEIRERQAMELALRESEERFRTLVENAADAFLLIDTAGRIRDVNQQACESLGYDRPELLSLSVSDIETQLTLEEIAAIRQQVSKTCTFSIESTHRRKNGSTFPVELRIRLFEASGEKLGLALVRDISERKQAEAALVASEEQLRQLAENMRQIFWMYSIDGTPIYISPAFEQIWGQSCDRWYTYPNIWLASVHPDDSDRVRTAFQTFRAQPECSFSEEYRIVQPNGKIRVIQDQAFPIRDQQGQIYRIAGIAEDVTERRQQQQEMLQATERLAEIGELAAMIVHEIRNPLTTVMLGLNAFQRLNLPEIARERLSLAMDEAERLRSLLNEILLYAKPQSLRQTELELNHLINDLLNSIRTLPIALGRRIEFTPAPHPIWLFGDQDKLKQVFINLVTNACEAVQEGEQITWEVIPQQQQVSILVKNPGEPIPPDLISKLTKPFFTTKASGTGLGLAIVKRIVEVHQGSLTIASSASTGTIVTVQLPMSSGIVNE
jgi:PAS domain S-box-containing protein